ncbi:MAG TPA: septum formation family protein, partial [Pseudonocardiaceae bacterium]|nr:septum formation family protein [Pseudonocardiaceae bacterium]
GTRRAGEPGTVGFDQIRPGDCLDQLPDTSDIDQVPRVACEDPHDEEVYTIVDLGDGPWPGAEAVNARAAQLCSITAEPFLGVSAEATELVLRWYQPVEEVWNYGDNTVLCIAADPSGKTTGSLRDSRR